MTFVLSFLAILGQLLEWCILVQVIWSWFRPSPGNRVYALLVSIVLPLYRMVGRVVPPIGPLDLRPLVALALLQLGWPRLLALLPA